MGGPEARQAMADTGCARWETVTLLSGMLCAPLGYAHDARRGGAIVGSRESCRHLLDAGTYLA
jgi:hypothetical protein